jgi:hypothetical protein
LRYEILRGYLQNSDPVNLSPLPILYFVISNLELVISSTEALEWLFDFIPPNNFAGVLNVQFENKPESTYIAHFFSPKKVENCQLRDLYSPGQTTLRKLTLEPREKGEEGITSIIAHS